ncbi:MAG: acyltransferase family protein [Lachnospiraceae bacterium]|nr:acyltransferase family protein [Lachnospiraceae bacterium]
MGKRYHGKLIFPCMMVLCIILCVMISLRFVDDSRDLVSPDINTWQSRYIVYDDSWYMDERIFRENGLNEEDENEIIYGPFVHLDKGSYYALVEYESAFDQALRVYAFENEDKIITEEETILPFEARQVCYKFCVTEDIDNFEIRVLYSGKGSFELNNIRVFRESWGRSYHFRNLLIVLGIVFLILTIVALRPDLYRGSYSSRRELWIDMVRGIAIILVLAGHSTGNPLSWFIYGFHIPLLFILSGFLYRKEKITGYIVKLARRYLVPYMIFCFANSLLRIPYMLVGNYTFSGIRNSIISYCIASLKGQWREMPNCMPLWYLPAITVALLVFRIIDMIPVLPVKTALYIVMAVTGYNWNALMDAAGMPRELPWGQHTICSAVAFIAIGNALKTVYRKVKDRTDLYNKRNKIIILGLFLTVGLSCLIVDHMYFHDVDVYFNKYGNIILTYMGALSMSLLVMGSCRWLSNRITSGNILVIIGCNSIFFFAFDFWGKTLALYFPRILDKEWWLMTCVIKFMFVSLLFVVRMNIRSVIFRKKVMS